VVQDLDTWEDRVSEAVERDGETLPRHGLLPIDGHLWLDLPPSSGGVDVFVARVDSTGTFM
jgi:hypothetical protein